MSKVIIIAPSDVDTADAVKLLTGAGYTVDVEEPTPKNLLHIVLGLMGPNAYGFGAGYALAPAPGTADKGAEAENDKDAEEAAPAKAKPDGEGELDLGAADAEPKDELDAAPPEDGDFNFESITVDGEPISVVASEAETSTLAVANLIIGPKTTYTLNESTFSLWVAENEPLVQRVEIESDVQHIFIELPITAAEDNTPVLHAGKDLQQIYKSRS